MQRRISNRKVASENLHVRYTKSRNVCSRIAGIFLSQGWDWTAFLENGIDIEIVEQTNDAMAQQVVEYVKNGRKQ